MNFLSHFITWLCFFFFLPKEKQGVANNPHPSHKDLTFTATIKTLSVTDTLTLTHSPSPIAQDS